MSKRSYGICTVSFHKYVGGGKSKTVTGKVELFIDTEALVVRLGRNALGSRGGRSRACSGAIEVKFIKGTRTESESL